MNNTNEPSMDYHELSSTDLGAIIGGCAGGLVVVITVTVLLCIRRRRAKERRNAKFDIGPIPNRSSIMINNRDLTPQPTIGQSFSQNGIVHKL
jgi:hypothetical protein